MLDIGARLGLPGPERMIPGHDGRSQVAIYADSVLKLYSYKAELNRSREVDALRRWRDTGLVPRLLAYDDGDGAHRWTHMTRIPGVLLDTVPLADRTASLIRDVGRALGRLHTAVPVRAEIAVPTEACRPVFGHGDFAARNVMVERRPSGAHGITGVIDVEKSQTVCFAADLTMYLMKTLMGEDAHWDSCLAGYLENAETAAGPFDLGPEHLALHVEAFRTWMLRAGDPDLIARAEHAINSVLRTGQGFRQPSR